MRKHTLRSMLLSVMVVMMLMSSVPAFAATNPAQSAATACNRAEFVADVTVKDGSTFQPGERFTKTWRIRNTGSCRWNTGYALVFVGGTQMSRRTVVQIPERVRPGQTVEVSVKMRAPEKVGDYRSYWMMRDDDGKRFGFGSKANTSIWASIKVKIGASSNVSFSFAGAYAKAFWRNANGSVPREGALDNPAGYVGRGSSTKLENGTAVGGSSLVVHPQWIAGGEIRGRYENVKIQRGDTFQATIGLMNGSDTGNVVFELRYRVNGQAPQTLKTWRQTYDGKVKAVEYDLSSLAGKTVTIFLIVRDSGSGDIADTYAAWVNPRIVR